MASNTCWGIELGAGAVKAMKLVRTGDGVRVADFIVIRHKFPLSTPELNPDDSMRVALGALTSQYDLSKATIAISAPGHASFARFAKLPPVEPKKIAGIVKYEAIQQIPFPLEEVEWDYQTFARDDSPEVEVGIFAMTRERVVHRLAQCAEVGLRPDILNLSPVAVFNAMAYDLPIGMDTPGMAIIDIGTVATDLIIADAGRVWVRTFPIGGHNFTEAIVEAFKLPYPKAEKLKVEAEQSKHKKHIFQAMRPVFTDLGQEVQRSISYYVQGHSGSEIKRVIGLGSTFRLIGLRKYISQQLQTDVTRCERFRQVQVEGSAEADFQSATLALATAYGLALQGLGMDAINANLVPVKVIREAVWNKKTPYFVTAAVLSLAAGGASFIRPTLDAAQIQAEKNRPELLQVRQINTQGKTLRDEWQKVSQTAQVGFLAENVLRLFERRELHASLVKDVSAMIATAPPTNPNGFEVRSLKIAYRTPSGSAPLWINAASIGGRDTQPSRSSRGGPASLPGGGGDRGGSPAGGGRSSRNTPGAGNQPNLQFGAFVITLEVESSHPDRSAFVDRTLLWWLRENASRPDAPYTFTTPTEAELLIEETAAGRGSASSPAPGSARPSPDSAAGTASLSTLAPLPPIPLPQAGENARFKYVLSWTASLAAPTKPVELTLGDTAPEQEVSQ